jgi:hypothetical protein
VVSAICPSGGGRTWWAHFEFTRINIELTYLPKKIEDLREPGAMLLNATAFWTKPLARRTLRIGLAPAEA